VDERESIRHAACRRNRSPSAGCVFVSGAILANGTYKREPARIGSPDSQSVKPSHMRNMCRGWRVPRTPHLTSPSIMHASRENVKGNVPERPPFRVPLRRRPSSPSPALAPPPVLLPFHDQDSRDARESHETILLLFSLAALLRRARSPHFENEKERERERECARSEEVPRRCYRAKGRRVKASRKSRRCRLAGNSKRSATLVTLSTFISARLEP